MKTPAKKRAAQVRAKVMFAGPESRHHRKYWFTVSSKHDDKIFCDFTRPVSVLPRSREAQEAMTLAAAKALFKRRVPGGKWSGWEDGDTVKVCLSDARACLAAVGIGEKAP